MSRTSRYLAYLAVLVVLPMIGYQVGAAVETHNCAKLAETEYVECDLAGLAGLSVAVLVLLTVMAGILMYEAWGPHRHRGGRHE